MSDDTVIAIRLDEATAYGYHAAAVLQQVRWVIKYERQRGIGDGAWFTGSSDDLAALTGLSADQVRRSMAKLLEAGVMDRERQIGPHGEGKPKYRPTGKPADSAGGDSATPRGGDSATPRGGDSATPSTIENREGDKPPPTPSDGGGDGLEAPNLFDESSKGKRRRRLAAAKSSTSSMVVAAGETFWEDWPSGKGRGQKATFMDAWCKRLTAGVDRNGRPITVAELMVRRDHYRDARARYHRFWESRGVEAHAPMLNGSTFVNSKSHLWADPWVEEDLRYWPPPRGYSWDDATADHGAVIGRSMFDALDAEIAAAQAAKEAG